MPKRRKGPDVDGLRTSRPGYVDHRDPLTTADLSRRWMMSRDLICKAAEQLGDKATERAVWELATKMQEEAAARGSRPWFRRKR